MENGSLNQMRLIFKTKIGKENNGKRVKSNANERFHRNHVLHKILKHMFPFSNEISVSSEANISK